MPVSVSVRMLSGDWNECKMPATASVGNLKYALSQQCGSRPNLWHIYNASFIKCASEDSLLDMAECPLADLLDLITLKRLLLEVELHALVCSDVCSVCGAASARNKCGACRQTQYCSRAANVPRAAFRIEARLQAIWPGFQPTGFQPASHAYESYKRRPSKIAGLPANEVTYVRYVCTFYVRTYVRPTVRT